MSAANKAATSTQTKIALLLCTLMVCPNLFAADAQRAFNRLIWSTDSTGRFISVHGRRSAVFGYSQTGLESWAYPLQILRSFGVAFRQRGASSEISGEAILRRIIYSPEAVTRIYAGPDFVVREKLFVPLDVPGAVITYEIQGARPVNIVVHFVPVLDLMWPASIGGQEAAWNPGASAYVISEPTHRFTASVGSPDVVTHDDASNATRRVNRTLGLAFTIRAGEAHNTAQVVIAGGIDGKDATVIAKGLLQEAASLERAAVDHYVGVLDHALQIDTPDPEVNRALAWSEIAVDQAWVCNPDFGCGVVAGYGPSRKARRPQYDWFFAGDGMVAIRALLAAGRYARAREELEFILKFQDRKTGMMWHEISQSAALLDWRKYPYMYVHVDLTFDILNTVDDYLSATADLGFVRKNWKPLQAAYQYCRSILDPKDGLPRIPLDKEGSREQDALADDLMLSATWVAAGNAFANLADATGHTSIAESARRTSRQANDAVSQRYWNERQQVWISGFTRSGMPLIDRDSRPAGIMRASVLTQHQRNSLLDQLASSDFQADWGTRGTPSSANNYDPNSYASGSVWAISTSAMATAFWFEHRPATALPIWNALVPWARLDSLGHMHETLAGDYYHEELESVPEQTWSSSSFFTTAVNGLLGLQVEGLSHRVSFAPHLPPGWDTITIRHVHVASSEITITMERSADRIRLQLHNEGPPVEMVVDPELPFGAQLRGAQIGGRAIVASLEQHPQDTHAKVEFKLPAGNTVLTIDHSGGITVLPTAGAPAIGEPSKAIKITRLSLSGRVFTLEFDHTSSASSTVDLRTTWKIHDAQGAAVDEIAPSLYRFIIDKPPGDKLPHAYQRGRLVVTLADSDPHAQ